MTSREIAELTGKEHSKVLRDVRYLLLQAYDLKDASDLSHEEIQGVTLTFDAHGYLTLAELDQPHTITLLTGYTEWVALLESKYGPGHRRSNP